MQRSSLIVIPARMASTRFPNKPLVQIAGVSMIERVWRIAQQVGNANRTVIATDDEVLRAFAEQFGAEVIMTSESCLTGTDRVAETAKKLKDEYDIVFSLQGDAVLTPPWIVNDVLGVLLEEPEIAIATPAVKLEGGALSAFAAEKKKGSSSGTSVVFNLKNDAMYFSKTMIPYDYNKGTGPCYRHIGLYGYRRDALDRMSTLTQAQFEKVEKLEQLRALEHGIPIRVVIVDYRGRTHASVDRPEDVAVVEEIIRQQGELI